MKYFLIIVSISLFLCSNCASCAYVSVDDIISGRAAENAVCKVTKSWDLKGETVVLPNSCKLIFQKGGCISNGTLAGENSILKYDNPFIGDGVTIKGCFVEGKRVIRDIDVFLEVSHTQQEIQTLFDISGGNKIEFTQGVYENVDRITISNNINADFHNCTINLYKDDSRMSECFYMEPWVDKGVEFVRIKNLNIVGDKIRSYGRKAERRCIQLFHVPEVELDNISIEGYDGGPHVFKENAKDLLDKTRIGTCAIAIMKYDKCIINNCRTSDINKEIFWCVPNDNPDNITYFTNNVSTCSYSDGSSSFFTILDGRCVLKGNKVYNYNGSAFNAFCYDSEICDNKFYEGKRSIAIDLSEGVMYQAKNVDVHNNDCFNSMGLIAAFGENLRIRKNRWINDVIATGERCYIITIETRGERTNGGRYIGCNNQETNNGSFNITIKNNVCENNAGGNGREVRQALLYGNNISFLNNTAKGLNVPVVQLVEGNDFEFRNNRYENSHNGYYAELQINHGGNLRIMKNTFSYNHSDNNISYTVHVLSARGELTFEGNSIKREIDDSTERSIYIPCYIQEDSELNQVDYYVKRRDIKPNVKTGLDASHIQLRTNIAQ